MMTAGQKRELDVRDFWRVYEGLETYAKLDAKGAMERLRGHKEDGLCNVTDFSGNGQLMCTRDGYNAIIELAERHREFLAVPDDYSLEELVAGVRKYIVKAIVDEKEEEAAVARVLSEAVADADKNHTSRTYHFPCVTVHYEDPLNSKLEQWYSPQQKHSQRYSKRPFRLTSEAQRMRTKRNAQSNEYRTSRTIYSDLAG